MSRSFVSADHIRSNFSRAMSDMYRKEVPAYGTLLDLVSDVNHRVLNNNPELKEKLSRTDNLSRISEERHGAIRLGTPDELRMIARVFSVMGMKPVGYYDLTQANVPVHSTAFRSVNAASLALSPFRVFTSLLRTDLINDAKVKKYALEILESRNIFTSELYELVDKAEKNGGLTEKESKDFIKEATYTFKWHEEAQTDKAFYEELKAADPRIADIVCFKGPHINHLTPRTLDIDFIHEEMPKHGMNAKNIVEGPPPGHNILLRQTSFKALTEKVKFKGEIEGLHTARFGEIEQRGAALTPKGRELYDELLNKVRGMIIPEPDGSNAEEYMKVLKETFEKFPSSYDEMRKNNLAYFQYYKTDKSSKLEFDASQIDNLVEEGSVGFMPIIYEDFLPVSAAGIFASNATDKNQKDKFESSSKEDFEKFLGQKVLSEFELYQKMEDNSITSLFY